MESPERVCPRCGHKAGRDEFCSECGLHLWDQPELPTRQKWEQAQSEGKLVGPTAEAGTRGPGGWSVVDWWRSLPDDTRVWLPVVVAVFAVVLVGYGTFAAVNKGNDIPFCCGNGTSDSQSFSQTDAASASDSSSPAAQCVELWNNSAGQFKKAELGGSVVPNSLGFVGTYSGPPSESTYNSANSQRDVATVSQGDCVVAFGGWDTAFTFSEGRWILASAIAGYDPLATFLASVAGQENAEPIVTPGPGGGPLVDLRLVTGTP